MGQLQYRVFAHALGVEFVGRGGILQGADLRKALAHFGDAGHQIGVGCQLLQHFAAVEQIFHIGGQKGGPVQAVIAMVPFENAI